MAGAAEMPAGPFFGRMRYSAHGVCKMESTAYEITLFLGRLCLHFISEVPLTVTDEIRNFCKEAERSGKENEKITVYVREMKEKIALPRQMIGEDLLLEYYYKDGYFLAAAKRGTKGNAAVTVYTPDFSEAAVYLNEAEFPGMIRRVSKILQLFPVRQALAGRQALILHSSRVLTGGKAVIFTAPSQTGKTTQAWLWKQYGDAEIVSNDRTLLQKEKEVFYTAGYPVDGSDPVCSSREIPPGAVVALCQGAENHVERLSVRKALKYLMEQTVADIWNAEEMGILQNLWLDFMEKHPVYLLTCTADQSAVLCLREQLRKDGVI